MDFVQRRLQRGGQVSLTHMHERARHHSGVLWNPGPVPLPGWASDAPSDPDLPVEDSPQHTITDTCAHARTCTEMRRHTHTHAHPPALAFRFAAHREVDCCPWASEGTLSPAGHLAVTHLLSPQQSLFPENQPLSALPPRVVSLCLSEPPYHLFYTYMCNPEQTAIPCLVHQHTP